MSGRYTLSSKFPCDPAKATAASLPITWADTWVSASTSTGLTFPGMIDEPGCRSGRRISASPVRGPDAIQRMSLPILTSATASARRLPDSSTRASRAPCTAKWSPASASGSSRSRANWSITSVGEPGGQLMPVPTAVPPSGSSPTLPSVDLRRARRLGDLGCVAAELLAERDRRGVHEVRATRLDDLGERMRLGPQRQAQVLQRREQHGLRLVRRRHVDRRREHVVRRLRGVDMVVGVDRAAEPLRRQVGQHLVGVHVGAGARTGLEHVDGEVARPSARRPPRRRRRRWRRPCPASMTPSRALACAAAPLMRASAAISEASRGTPEIGKFSTARCVWAPHRAVAGTRTSPMRVVLHTVAVAFGRHTMDGTHRAGRATASGRGEFYTPASARRWPAHAILAPWGWPDSHRGRATYRWSAAPRPSESVLALAEEVGRLLAQRGCVVVTGGRAGRGRGRQPRRRAGGRHHRRHPSRPHPRRGQPLRHDRRAHRRGRGPQRPGGDGRRRRHRAAGLLRHAVRGRIRAAGGYAGHRPRGWLGPGRQVPARTATDAVDLALSMARGA